MKTLSVRGLHFWGMPSEIPKNTPYWKCVHEGLAQFSYEFEFGKSYLLNAKLRRGAWALSWLIAGIFKPTGGKIYLDGKIYEQEARRRDSWCPPSDEIKRWGRFYQTVQHQVQHGLRHNPKPYFSTEEEYMKHFIPEVTRYKRKMRSLSNAKWRASCAIGLANGKKLFCFPYIDFVRRGFFVEYNDLWFKRHVEILCDSGALVLIPAQHDHETEGLCDVVVNQIDSYARPPNNLT